MNYIIYKCYCKDNSVKDIYIGSTIDLEKRIKFHKKDYDEKPAIKLYNCMKLNGGFSNWVFESLEENKAEDRTSIRQREQYYMNELKPSLNSVRAYLTSEERRVIRNKARAKYREKYPEKTKYWNDKISKWRWTCDVCNQEYSYTIKARHLKTKKHNDNVNGLERRPRNRIGENKTRCDQTTQTPQKKSFTEQEYLEVLQNPDNYNQFFEFCGECGT